MNKNNEIDNMKKIVYEEQGMTKTQYTFTEDLNSRTITINDEITPAIVDSAIMRIIKFNKEDSEKNISVENRIPIEIYLNTNGGDVHTGMGLVDSICNSKTPVHIACVATAFSMGSLILISGHKRSINKNGVVLIHSGSMTIGGTSDQVKDMAKFYEKYGKQIDKHIIAKTKISQQMLSKKSKTEWYITADEALQFGIVDEIL